MSRDSYIHVEIYTLADVLCVGTVQSYQDNEGIHEDTLYFFLMGVEY